MKKISILVPCYDEEAVLDKFYLKTNAVLDAMPQYNFEIVFVDDGSEDNTLQMIKDWYVKDTRVSYVALSRNFGKEIAMIAGMDYIDSDALIIMDADLQDPPALIPELVKWWEKGYQDVYAKRLSRDSETFLKKWTSSLYYKLLQRTTKVCTQVDVGDFRLLDRPCVEAVKSMRESQRYTKGLFSWIGFKQKEVLFNRDARAGGKTHWNYWQLLNLAIEGITSFTILPLRLATFVGIILAIIALLYMVFIIVRTVIFGNDVPGYPSLISIILFMGGIQLIFLGIIGEYLGRVFNESKNRPLYFVKEYSAQKIITDKE